MIKSRIKDLIKGLMVLNTNALRLLKSPVTRNYKIFALNYDMRVSKVTFESHKKTAGPLFHVLGITLDS